MDEVGEVVVDEGEEEGCRERWEEVDVDVDVEGWERAKKSEGLPALSTVLSGIVSRPFASVLVFVVMLWPALELVLGTGTAPARLPELERASANPAAAPAPAPAVSESGNGNGWYACTYGVPCRCCG